MTGGKVEGVRGMIEAHDGGLIYTAYRGLSPDGHTRTLKGEPIPDGTPIRTTPTFPTAHPGYAWLNRVHALGTGDRQGPV
jgi:hypothetical protein